MTDQATTAARSPASSLPAGLISPELLAEARGQLADRGIDPSLILGKDDFGNDTTTTGFYVMLGVVSATEKAGQSPTYAAARLAMHAGLPSEVADTLFLAYNQQSAEEAGHGDKVFGNAYFVMGGQAPSPLLSVVGSRAAQAPDPAANLLAIGADPKQNKKRLGSFAGLLGGIETVALQRAFPRIVALCEGWDHPVAHDLLAQIRDVVRPEESRHVLLFRYVFHQLIAHKGANVIEAFRGATNAGRTQLGADALDHDAFARLVGSSAPTPRQLLGKDRVAFS